MSNENFSQVPDDIVSPEEEHPKHSASFIRHSVSSYKTYGELASSEAPLEQMDPNNQATQDLTERGIELARREAEKFFAGLSADTDALFFASSNEMRAIETADIFRQVAHERGFEVIKPEHVRNRHAEEIGEGEIRVIHNLSIYPDNKSNTVIDSVFNPPQKRGAINWAAINNPELKAKFDRASAIIEADDKGSFGPNFLAHSEAIKEIFPGVTTAKELHDTQFKNMMKLFRLGMDKAKKSGLKKNVKILSFGHENYWMDVVQAYFQEDGIKNCEVVQLELKDDKTKVEFRGKKTVIE